MKPKIPDNLRAALRGKPVYSPILSEIETDETALIMRVDNPKSFRQKNLVIAIKFFAWRSDGGLWVTGIAFQVNDNPADPLKGDAYINPRQERDHRLLLNLTRQERFPVFFLSDGLNESVGKAISWREEQRQEVEKAVELIGNDLGGTKLAGEFDPVFEKAKAEFQEIYPLEKLLD